MALKVLQLNDFAVRQALKHELLKGKKAIGRGAFSVVYEGSKPNTVYKVTMDNFSYWMLNCWASGVSHDLYPKVINNVGRIGEMKIGTESFDIYLYEVERLEKLKAGTDARKLAMKIREEVAKSTALRFRKADVALFTIQNVIRGKNLPVRVMNALMQLEEFCCNYPGSSLDMHLGNFMQRKNGDLVITDPLMCRTAYHARLTNY